MEVAAALTDKAHSVSVIGIESVPFKQALGEKVGKAIMKVDTGKSIALVSVGTQRAFSSRFCLFAALRSKRGEVLHDERGVGDGGPSRTGAQRERERSSDSAAANEAPTHLVLFPQLKEVVLNSGKVLRADVCVIGAGDMKWPSRDPPLAAYTHLNTLVKKEHAANKVIPNGPVGMIPVSVLQEVSQQQVS